jgi:hypothetical protein
MKANRIGALGALTILLLSSTMLAGCAKREEGPATLYAMEPPPAPAAAYDPDKVGDAISTAAGSTPKTTIYTNVLNGSGGSCVDAATTRGQAIADKLQGMKNTGQIPADHTVEVHTYSGYRVPYIDYGSLHTYTVTQVKGPDGRVKDTWTSDNYLGPNSNTHYTGDGGYSDWTDVMTAPVQPSTTLPPKLPNSRTGGSGGGGGGSSGGGGGGGGGEG